MLLLLLPSSSCMVLSMELPALALLRLLFRDLAAAAPPSAADPEALRERSSTLARRSGRRGDGTLGAGEVGAVDTRGGLRFPARSIVATRL